MTAAAEERFNKTIVASLFFGFFHISGHARKIIQIFCYEFSRSLAVNSGCPGKANWPHAINYTEIQNFCLPPHFSGNFFRHNLKDLGGGSGVNVLAVAKCFYHFFVLGDMGNDT